MSQFIPKKRLLTQVFGILLGIALTLWLLRGFSLLTFIPGGIITLLLLLSIVVGVLSILQRRWNRF